MRSRLLLFLALVAPTVAWAGRPAAMTTAPTLGESGLIALGIALVAVGGAGILRRRKR